MQRPPAEIIHAGELEALRAADEGPRPPGWLLSARAVRTFILGDPARNVRKKFVGNPSLVDRAMVALATNRGLIFVGEPGTAKSLLSELLAAAICGKSTLTIQGSAGTTDDQVKYSWNYALLLAEGPTPRALVPAPLYTGMKEGGIVRFEEITRCPLEIQDSLLAALSDRVLAIPEMEGAMAMLFAKEGFNVIATANTRDLGVNEMSAALKRRFNFETVFPIPDFETEMALVREETERLLKSSGVPSVPGPDVLELLVTTFRELRAGLTVDGQAMDRLSVPMSTAEAVSVAHAMGVRSYFMAGGEATPADLVECLIGAAIKTDAEDVARLRRYFEQRVYSPEWVALRAAREETLQHGVSLSQEQNQERREGIDVDARGRGRSGEHRDGGRHAARALGSDLGGAQLRHGAEPRPRRLDGRCFARLHVVGGALGDEPPRLLGPNDLHGPREYLECPRPSPGRPSIERSSAAKRADVAHHLGEARGIERADRGIDRRGRTIFRSAAGSTRELAMRAESTAEEQWTRQQ